MQISPIKSVAANNGGVSILITSTHLLGFNNTRKGCIIVNSGAFPVFLALNPAPGSAAANQGIYLGANGGAVQLDMNGALWQGAVDAIAVGGASIVTYSELT